MSPEKYIIQKGRDLEFHECVINDNWSKSGLAIITVCKKMPSGNLVACLYLLDIYCLGLKNTLYNFNMSELEYEDFVEKTYSKQEGRINKCETVFAHNIIYGAIDYAENLGFLPQKDFKTTEFLLNPDLLSDEIDDIEFGKDGKPLFIQGPNDNATRIINKLNETVGRDNYHYMRAGEDIEM
ncbi:MAG: hypothetical protein B6I20_06830 [Bacteroidetes bacterium 4572_117]|nr:MAG: hypothetical protein B6I20_06830 [Bacteroidetes bacterium 4572_117]